MPKGVNSSLRAHLSGRVTSVCTCVLITRKDGRVFAFTDHDTDIQFRGDTYLAATGFMRSAVSANDTMAVDNMQVIGILDNAEISEKDLILGLFDHAEVQIFLVNWAAPEAMGPLKLRSGWLGEVVVHPTGSFSVELQGLNKALTTVIGDVYSPLCRADLGDPECGVNLAAYTGNGTVVSSWNYNSAFVTGVSYTPGQDETMATVTFTGEGTVGMAVNVQVGAFNYYCMASYTLNSTDWVKLLASSINGAHASGFPATATEWFSVDNVHSVIISKTVPTETGNITKANDPNGVVQISNFAGAGSAGDAYLAGGLCTWLTGPNAGSSMEIKTFDYASGYMQLFMSMPYPIAPGDTFRYQPGCDKTRETCRYRYNNMPNFRGEPDLPGLDQMMKYPDS